MLNENHRELTISAARQDQRVVIFFRDTGCGVGDPDRLFRPFQEGSHATGLGLYLSRAFVRSFNGDLRYAPAEYGATFVVELSPVAPFLSTKDGFRPAPEIKVQDNR
jgi:C4-dicarboxylate-specific signal transduction histidine kinase